jgi:N-acetylmuramoyl-L-alanine amidase
MGDRFGRSYYQSAVDSYEFLIREYPANHFCQDAMLRVAKLQKDQLGDSADAAKSYNDFLKKYPRSPHKREVQEALAELALLQNSESAKASDTAAKNPSAAIPSREDSPSDAKENNSSAITNSISAKKSGGTNSMERADAQGVPHIRRIRSVAKADSTRITIDLEDSVQYMSARISNPDRIFFDLHAARLTPELARGNIKVDGTLLTAIRVAQNQSGVVRVVLDVNGVKDYTASLSNNPTQLIIDLYGNTAPAAPVKTAKAKSSQAQQPAEDAADNSDSSPAKEMEDKPVVVAAKNPPADTFSAPTQSAANANNSNSGPASTDSGSAVTRDTLPSSKKTSAKSLRAKNGTKPDLVQTVSAPQPTHDGQSTLTRALGLKIGRIVIDAGHGGHDTGTIGPTGLMEKDLCLDVALRLGKIIQQRLPGADVVYTRSDDTFIPLEERTTIANQAKADLFISIHANSSQDHAARGIETYYLNLKGSPEAIAVAARENAVAQESIHDLEDLVKKIARNEKIDESREFAEDIQSSLSQRIQKVNKTAKNRGVRKAPFVVLIGADMPSILTEISFLSNPSDEQLLKKPEQRQRVAEGLYQGVASYLQSLNSVTQNSSPAIPGSSHALIPVEQSRNQK